MSYNQNNLAFVHLQKSVKPPFFLEKKHFLTYTNIYKVLYNTHSLPFLFLSFPFRRAHFFPQWFVKIFFSTFYTSISARLWDIRPKLFDSSRLNTNEENKKIEFIIYQWNGNYRKNTSKTQVYRKMTIHSYVHTIIL